MDCPHCDWTGHSTVIDSRGSAAWIYRRRQCDSCGKRFTTHEKPVEDRVNYVPVPKKELKALQNTAARFVALREIFSTDGRE